MPPQATNTARVKEGTTETPRIKTEPIESPKSKTQLLISDEDDEVAQEFSVVLLRQPPNASASRLLFYQQVPQQMEFCSGRMKREVKHMELDYQAEDDEESDDLSELYDGIYNGEDLDKCNPLRKHAVGFFKSGRFYIMPLHESYEMHRKIYRPKPMNVHEQNKIDDEKLGQLDAEPTAKAVRVSFVRNETDWQRRQRERSAGYKKQQFDNDPWIELDVKKSNAKNVYAVEIKASTKYKSAVVNDYKLPEL